MNPLDALLVPPALVKRALDDLHDIAVLARRYKGLVRESVDELEPMIADLDQRMRAIEPKLEEMQESIEPIATSPRRSPATAVAATAEHRLSSSGRSRSAPPAPLATKLPGSSTGLG